MMNIKLMTIGLLMLFLLSVQNGFTVSINQTEIPDHIRLRVAGLIEGQVVKQWIIKSEEQKYVVLTSNAMLLEVDFNGNLISKSILINKKKLPDQVLKKAESEMNQGEKIDKIFLVDNVKYGKCYRVFYNKGKEKRMLLFNPQGEFAPEFDY